MIKIKIYNLNIYKINVYINNQSYLCENGVLLIDAKPGVYKITILDKTIIVLYRNGDLVVPFIFDKKKEKIKVVFLFDKYYKNLKIERGEIFLNGL